VIACHKAGSGGQANQIAASAGELLSLFDYRQAKADD
jgi:hypothetical protein